MEIGSDRNIWTYRSARRHGPKAASDVEIEAGEAIDVQSELEVLPGAPFTFRYGYDFEHHTPLDPFRWQYLVVRCQEGKRLSSSCASDVASIPPSMSAILSGV